jgi:hypothetical protein
VRGLVGAQDACQHDRVGVVGLGARHVVAIPVAGHGQGVDRVHAPAGGAQAGHQQAAAGLDGDRDRVGGGVTRLGEQLQELLIAGRVVADAATCQQPALVVDYRDVMVAFRPVDPAEHPHGLLLLWLIPAGGSLRPRGALMGGLKARHPISRP